MWLKYPIIILLFLITAIFQVSFLPYFGVMTIIPNLVFILFFAIIFLKEEKDYYYELLLVVVAGFSLDIFSNHRLGISIVSLFVLYLLIQLTRHVIEQRQDEGFVGYYVLSFLVCFFIYGLLVQLLSHPFTMGMNVGIVTVVQMLYNVALALFALYAYEEIADFLNRDRQLKLL